ncbi:MAG: hypothetical protein K1X31_14540 [Gemmatimonadaceae bacterium]|nr:hypothetical protein [Gemmatimonadaceae bacterium]
MVLLKRLAIVALLAPVAFELTVRADDWVRFGVPLSSGATHIMDLRVADSLGRHARAGTTWRKFHINALGFRGPEVDPAALARRPLVMVTGASETFGLYESAGREWPMQLADSLASRCAAEPPVVLNAAFAGMSLPTVRQDLARRLLPMRPRVVIYYPQPAGYLYPKVPVPAPAGEGAGEPLSPLAPRALPRLREDLKSIIPDALLDLNRQRSTVAQREAGDSLFPALPRERLDSIEAHLRAMVGQVRAAGAELVLVVPQHGIGDSTSITGRRWLTAWESVVPKATGAMLLAFADSGAARVRRLAADSGVRLIDPPFPDGAAREAFYADPNHFTDRGSALLGGAGSAIVGRLLGCPR